MCLGALYWARPRAVYFAATRDDAAEAGFDDRAIYEQVPLSPEKRSLSMAHRPHERADEPFERWKASPNRVNY